MPRGPRICFPGAVLHVLNRFVDRHPFFRTDEDYEHFLDIYSEEAAAHEILTLAYDLMPNHFHFVILVPNGEISRFLCRFLSRSAQSLNRAWKRSGVVFQGRTKTLIVDSDEYFETVMGYVLTNRLRAGLASSVFADEWNSVAEMLSRHESGIARDKIWPWLFGEAWGARPRNLQLRECRRWLRALDAQAFEKTFRDGHRGSFLSGKEYRKKILDRIERRKRKAGYHLRRKTDRVRAPWTLAELRAAAEQSAKTTNWQGEWKNADLAMAHICWFLCFTEAGWSLERIRETFLPAGTGHSRISMAIRRIRQTDAKRHAAEQARAFLDSPGTKSAKVQG